MRTKGRDDDDAMGRFPGFPGGGIWMIEVWGLDGEELEAGKLRIGDLAVEKPCLAKGVGMDGQVRYQSGLFFAVAGQYPANFWRLDSPHL